MSDIDARLKKKLLKPHRLARGVRAPLRDASRRRVTPTRTSGRFGAVGVSLKAR